MNYTYKEHLNEAQPGDLLHTKKTPFAHSNSAHLVAHGVTGNRLTKKPTKMERVDAGLARYRADKQRIGA